jgi:hypothetical protein
MYVNHIRHMLSVFACFCALISVEYILINKTNVCVLIFGFKYFYSGEAFCRKLGCKLILWSVVYQIDISRRSTNGPVVHISI